MTVKINQILKHSKYSKYFIVVDFWDDATYGYVHIRNLNTQEIYVVHKGTLQANYVVINEG
jgi:hypothetical protein